MLIRLQHERTSPLRQNYAVEMAPDAASPAQTDGDLYQRARHLRNQGDDLTGLAREWNRETGELELAADLQEHLARRTGPNAGGSRR